MNDHAVAQRLCEAAAGESPWNVALQGVHEALGVSATQFFVVEKATMRLDVAENSGASPPDVMFDYVRFGWRIDPHVAHAAALPVGEVLVTARVFPRDQYKDHVYHREMWGPHNVREVLGAKVAENDHYVAMFGVTRQYVRPPFVDEDIDLMRRYTAHVVAALQIAKHLENTQTNAEYFSARGRLWDLKPESTMAAFGGQRAILLTASIHRKEIRSIRS